MPEQPRSFYSRLFPDHWGNHASDLTAKLADWVEDPKHRGDRPPVIPRAIPSGYVYFGQFITHDLSHDHTEFSLAGVIPPEATNNWRTPCLDLEILYGGGRTADEVLYDPIHPRGSGYLNLGSTVGATGTMGTDNDLARDASGHAKIYDARNDSTLLLGQLHVLLTKFHNRILDDLRDGKISAVSDGDLFESARQLVTWHYQWIVRNDFLPKIAMPDVLEDIIMHWPRLYRPKPGNVSIPVEFSLAAFQYGHSGVQLFYNVNRHLLLCSQEQTMYLTGLGGFQWPPGAGAQYTRLPEKFVVDPSRLFGWAPPAKSNFSATIDTLISEGLYRVPGKLSILLNRQELEKTGLVVTRFHGVPTFKLPEATLRRGAAVGLPSGQQACELAGVDCLADDQMAYDPDLEDFLRKNGMLHRTPLFYYLLREAEVSGRTAPGRPPGTRLGPLGSRIVAEVILGVLNADPDSYIHAGWEPPEISGDSPDSGMCIDNLKKLMFYAKDYKSPRQRMPKQILPDQAST